MSPAMMTHMMREFGKSGLGQAPAAPAAPVVPVEPRQHRLDLPPIDTKLDGPEKYLSWSRRVRYTLAGKNLEGYLTGDKAEPMEDALGRDEWKATHMQVYIWLLSSLPSSIADTVDGLEKVHEVWDKLKRTYDGVGNIMRVYQIKGEISDVVQWAKTVQEYAIELERLWLEHDHYRVRPCCSHPTCSERETSMEDRTMLFLKHLAPAFEQKVAMLLSRNRIPSLAEAVSAMIQEESRMRLQAGAGGLPGVKSALVVSNSGNTGYRGETRQCYNCDEVGHLKQACPKPPKERDTCGRGQFGSLGRGRGGRRGGRGGNRAHLMVAEEEEEAGWELTEEDQALVEAYSQGLRSKQKLTCDGKSVRDDASTSTSSRGNFASLAHTATGTHDTFALASIPTTRSPDWIVDSGASRHVTGAVGEFSSYTRLAVPESIQTADGTAQPVVGDLPREGDRQAAWD
ncbi:uncharacterized protein LOC144557937 [Carex rostrata]